MMYFIEVFLYCFRHVGFIVLFLCFKNIYYINFTYIFNYIILCVMWSLILACKV